MNHSFNVGIAKKYGVSEAIIIENFYFWIEKNRANEKHCHDGSYWTYNSVKAFAQLFPYWSTRQIERTLKKMEEAGAIKTGNYNKVAYDRTKWYGLTDLVYSIYANGEMEITKEVNGNHQTVEPIPDINTVKKPSINKDIRHKYGEFKNVLLSDPNYKELEFLTGDIKGYIKRLDEYIESTGRKYKNHYLTIRNWYNRDKEKMKPEKKRVSYSEGWD